MAQEQQQQSGQKKPAANNFVKGLITDHHALSTDPQEMIDAQNIDLIAVGAGYQLILQKREGNAQVYVIPSIWDTNTTYTINEFALVSGIAYISLQDGNAGNNPIISPAWWSALPSVQVPAGLPIGYKPLAVAEYNNVGYIISVNPDSGAGQIGSFPSPDYSQFIYITGAPISGGVGTITNVYDPSTDTPNYQYTITPLPGSGTNDAIDASQPGPLLLPSAGYTIKNTGLLPDTYKITDIGGVEVIDTYVNGILYTPGVSADIAINSGSSAVITYKVPTPFVSPAGPNYLVPNTAETRHMTILATTNPSPPAAYDYLFMYHVIPVIGAQSSISHTYTLIEPLVDNMANTGGSFFYTVSGNIVIVSIDALAITNVSALNPPLPDTRHWVDISVLPTIGATIYVNQNPGPPPPIPVEKQVDFIITAHWAGGIATFTTKLIEAAS